MTLKMKKIILPILLCLAAISAWAAETSEVSAVSAASESGLPECGRRSRAAVVISRTSFIAREAEVSGAAKSWTALASLAGMPYSTLFIEDLDEDVLSSHEVFVFSQCTFLTDEEYAACADFIRRVTETGGGLVIDGPLGLFNESEDFRENYPVDSMLGIRVGDSVPLEGYRLRVRDNDHYVTAPYEPDQAVSNLLTSELPAMSAEGADVLLRMTDDVRSYPYLSVRSSDGVRLAVLDGLSSAACMGASFRNYDPKGFFPSETYPILRRTLQWCAAGDAQGALPSLLISGAGMTALIRVDGDGSQVPASMDLCMTWLEDIAEESGVQAVMTYVSSWATRGGWHFYADHSRRIQEQGSVIGTHTVNHLLSELTTPEEYSRELDGSKEEIRSGLASHGYDPGEIRFLVNPGNGVSMQAHGEIADRFDFFMTHGLDQSLPVAYGAMSWFTDGKRLPVVNDGPSPDYQWFYDSTWSYSTPEVASYELMVLDHLYDKVGNGVIFNAMWHDYGMSGMLAAEPRNVTRLMRDGTRIINADNREYYEVMRGFWNTHDIYCPEPAELAAKMLLQANASVAWGVEDDCLRVKVRFADEDFEKYAAYVGGMALGVSDASEPISSVEIGGVPYRAFTENKVILPVPASSEMDIVIRFGEPDGAPRLTYSSKVLESVSVEGDVLKARFRSRSVSRFSFAADAGHVLLGAGSYSVSHDGRFISGRMKDGGEVSLVPVESDVMIHSSTLPFTSVKAVDGGLEVGVLGDGAGDGRIVWSSASHPERGVCVVPRFEGIRTVMLGTPESAEATASGSCIGDFPFAEVLFRPTDEDFINPERGFVSNMGSGEDKLDAKTLERLKAAKESMVWRQFDLDEFRDCAISERFLRSIRREFDLVRDAGMKIIPRFAYCNRIGDKDAPLDIVLMHIDQLAPILRENADIIATMNCGFIGAWGEMHSSAYGLDSPENMRTIVSALLDVLPKERTVQIRYPTGKAEIFGGRTEPITLEEAFSGKPYARVGHHNDCFLASPDDVGTYRMDVKAEKEFLNTETLYTPMGGETCNPRNNYPVYYRKTIEEMEMMHWSYLNSRYSHAIMDQWRDGGYYDEISRRLGYRLELSYCRHQTETAPGSSLSFMFRLKNVGFASPYNPRMVELILINRESGESYKALLPQDPRFWFPGQEVEFSCEVGLPEDVPVGEYDVYLNLPDPMERLYSRPEYSIRLANEGVAFTGQGYNDLGIRIRVTDAPAPHHDTFLKFRKSDE